ncbi:MAG: RIP metalloprotease RseP [Gammaproteobacteria bacterium]|nr:RIP metalloprotease RseP [Candidatus Thioaporhodococcus sediminis]TNF53301.1 MAG: RIP metalloprotease RseP [Gammaproteobacteria bacterium]
MPDLLHTLLSFVAALAILIAVHEFGHFWVARRLGVKVLRFSIGFGRPLLRRVGRDGTEYVLAGIPLGGYVKMLDEREEAVDPAEAHLSFNRQLLWKRTAIVLAGPLFNLAFAILLYWGILVVGDTGSRALIGTVTPGSIAAEAGLEVGDEMLRIGDRPTPTWEAAIFALMAESLDGEDLPVTIRDRYGDEQRFILDGRALAALPDDPAILTHIGLSPAQPPLPPRIGSLVPGEAAAEAGLKPGDLILGTQGEPITTWDQWVKQVRDHPGQPLAVQLERKGEEIELELTPRPVPGPSGEIGRVGAGVEVPEELVAQYRAVVRLGPLDAIQAAFLKTADMSWLMLKVMGRMLTGQASLENLSGPISIAEGAGRSASHGLAYFIKFLAVVSISLGVLNLLPIPLLDGGHLLYFLFEAVKGSPLSEQVQMLGQRIGVLLLAALMSLAFYVDIQRLLN